MIHHVPVMERLNVFLDKHVLPYPVRYLTNRVTILLTLSLLIPLIVLANVTVFVLAANSYLNVMSVVVSSTVLLYSTLSESRDRAAAEQREKIAATHQKMLDDQAAQDHKRIGEIHDHLNDLSTELSQHVTASLDTIQNVLISQLKTLQDEDHAHIEDTHKIILEAIAAHRSELDGINQILSKMK
jgi:hypothetical protein